LEHTTSDTQELAERVFPGLIQRMRVDAGERFLHESGVVRERPEEFGGAGTLGELRNDRDEALANLRRANREAEAEFARNMAETQAAHNRQLAELFRDAMRN